MLREEIWDKRKVFKLLKLLKLFTSPKLFLDKTSERKLSTRGKICAGKYNSSQTFSLRRVDFAGEWKFGWNKNSWGWRNVRQINYRLQTFPPLKSLPEIQSLVAADCRFIIKFPMFPIFPQLTHPSFWSFRELNYRIFSRPRVKVFKILVEKVWEIQIFLQVFRFSTAVAASFRREKVSNISSDVRLQFRTFPLDKLSSA